MAVPAQNSNQPVREQPVILKITEKGSYISSASHPNNVYGIRLIEKFEGDPKKRDGSIFTPGDLRPGTVIRFYVGSDKTKIKFENLGTVAFKKGHDGRYYLLAAENKDGEGLTVPKLKPAKPPVEPELKSVNLPAAPERAAEKRPAENKGAVDDDFLDEILGKADKTKLKVLTPEELGEVAPVAAGSASSKGKVKGIQAKPAETEAVEIELEEIPNEVTAKEVKSVAAKGKTPESVEPVKAQKEKALPVEEPKLVMPPVPKDELPEIELDDDPPIATVSKPAPAPSVEVVAAEKSKGALTAARPTTQAAPAPSNDADDDDDYLSKGPKRNLPSWAKKPIVKEKIVDLDEKIEARLWEVLDAEAALYQKTTKRPKPNENFAAMLIANASGKGLPFVHELLKDGSYNKELALSVRPKVKQYALAKKVIEFSDPAKRSKFLVFHTKLRDFLGNMPKDKVLTPFIEQTFAKYKR